MRSFLKDVLSVGMSKGLIIFFGLSTSIITARLLGPEGNGIVASLLVFPSMFMSFGSLGIRQSTTYFLGKNIYKEDEVKRSITQIWMITASLSVLVCYVLIKVLSKQSENDLYISLVLVGIPFSLFNTYNSGVFLGKNQIKEFNKINWVPIFLTLLSTIVLVFVMDFGVSGYLVSLIIGPLFISLLLLFKNKFFIFFSFKVDFEIIRNLLGLGVKFALALLVINLNYRIDIILLDKLSTEYEVGIYSKGVSITEYLWQVPMLLSTIIFARSAVAKNNQLFSNKVLKLLRISLLIILLIASGLFSFSTFIINTLFGESFQESSLVLQILLPGAVLLAMFKIINMDLSGKGKPWLSMKAMLPALIINIILNIILIPGYGSQGAALASSISYTVATVIFLYIYSSELNVPIRKMLTYRKTDFTDLKTALLQKIR